ncbi:MAG: hypothetical protein KDE51_01660, partial [Anaerolineales bacterium]|nr:hypothetical protein [Anaerolineales bacterium]
YTLHVWAREDGFQFDRLILSNDPTFVPTGIGPQVSQRAKSYSGRYAAQAHLTQQQYSYADAQLVSDLQTFTIWNTLLANLGMLFTAPLGLLLPWAYRTRRKKLAQYMVMGALGLAFVTSGAGLVWGATPIASINTAANQTVTLPTAALPTQSAGLPLNIINYRYDPLGRLTEANHNDGTRFGYTYDAVGNRLTATMQPSLVSASSQTDTFTYDAANRLTGRNGTPFTYDHNGNLLNDGEFSYSYDSANRLKTMQDVAAVSLTSYAYNGDGVRVLQNMDGIDTHYVQDVAATLPHVLASEEGGTLNLSLWGVGLIGEERGGTGTNALPAQWQFNLPDALGSIRQVTDAAGGLALSRSYDPFGNLLSSAGDGTTPYGFAGEEQGASGHMYLRARTYNPAVGRFLQQDTVFGNPANPRTLHRYAYGFNNPINYTDPSGRMPTQGGHALPLQNTAARSASAAAPSAAAASDGANRSQFVDARTAALSKGQFESIQGSSCFLDGILGFLQETALELLDFATHTVKMLESLLNMVRDPSNWRHHLDQAAAHGKEAHNFLKEHKTAIAQIIVSLTPLDTMSDIFTFVTGYDVWTGEKVSWQERVMAGVFAAFDIFTGGFGDDLLQATQTMAKMAGAAKGTVKFAGKMAKGIVSGVGNLLVRGVRGLLDMGANLGRMVLKGADDLLQVMRRSADDLLDVGRHQIDELDDLGRGVLKGSDNATLVVDSGQEAVARASRHVDTDGKWVDNIADGPSCSRNSFTAETTVETDEGAKPIEDIAIGDRVLGEDPLTGEQGYFEVVALTDHPTDQIIQVIIQVGDDSQPDDEDSEQPAEEDDAAEDDEEDHSQTGRVEVMNVTPEHPIYVEGDGWLHANNLEAGDRLRLADGGMAKVLAIDQPDLDVPTSVYNFTVRGPHTYFVLETKLLVHNCSDVNVQELYPHTYNHMTEKVDYTHEEAIKKLSYRHENDRLKIQQVENKWARRHAGEDFDYLGDEYLTHYPGLTNGIRVKDVPTLHTEGATVIGSLSDNAIAQAKASSERIGPLSDNIHMVIAHGDGKHLKATLQNGKELYLTPTDVEKILSWQGHYKKGQDVAVIACHGCQVAKDLSENMNINTIGATGLVETQNFSVLGNGHYVLNRPEKEPIPIGPNLSRKPNWGVP